jgi:hypothetical protein
MATIPQIKTAANTDIRAKTIANSVTRDAVADLIDSLADEQLSRGIKIVANTAALSGLLGTDYKYALVTDVGVFEFASSGTPNGTTIFAASGSGVFVAKLLIPTSNIISVSGTPTGTGVIGSIYVDAGPPLSIWAWDGSAFQGGPIYIVE